MNMERTIFLVFCEKKESRTIEQSYEIYILNEAHSICSSIVVNYL